MRSRGTGWRVLAGLAGLSLACGGGGGTTAPSVADTTTSTPAATVSGLDFTVTPDFGGRTTVDLRWSGSGATRYRVEAGNVLSAFTDGTSFTWTNPPVGLFDVRVVPFAGDRAGTPSASVSVRVVDARDVAEALYLGTGALMESGNAAHVLTDRIEGWPAGSAVRIVVDTALPSSSLQGVVSAAADFGAATGGAITGSVAERRASPREPLDGEVTVATVGSEEYARVGCGGTTSGCTRTTFRRSEIVRATIVFSAAAPEAGLVAHEVGHAFGLAHIRNPGGIKPVFTMIPSVSGRVVGFEPAARRAIEAASRAGLFVGGTRAQLAAAGVVGSSASVLRPSHAGETVRVETHGDETVVIRSCD